MADRGRPLRERDAAAGVAAGREPSSLERTVTVLVDYTAGQGIPRSFNSARLPPLSNKPEEIADMLRSLAAEGVSHARIPTIPMTIREHRRLRAGVLRFGSPTGPGGSERQADIER